MPRKLRELRSELKRNSWRIDRQTGSHQIWEHPLVPNTEINLAGSDGADAHGYQERDVKNGVRLSRAAERAALRRKQP
jgi:hypothetical protein